MKIDNVGDGLGLLWIDSFRVQSFVNRAFGFQGLSIRFSPPPKRVTSIGILAANLYT